MTLARGVTQEQLEASLKDAVTRALSADSMTAVKAGTGLASVEWQIVCGLFAGAGAPVGYDFEIDGDEGRLFDSSVGVACGPARGKVDSWNTVDLGMYPRGTDYHETTTPVATVQFSFGNAILTFHASKRRAFLRYDRRLLPETV